MVRTEGPSVVEKEDWFLVIKPVGGRYARTKIPRTRSATSKLEVKLRTWAKRRGTKIEEAFITKSKGISEFTRDHVLMDYFVSLDGSP